MAKRYYIANQDFVLDGEYRTKAAAKRAVAVMVREAARNCRRSKKRCSVVKTSPDSVKIVIGGRQGYHLWQSYYVRKG